MLLDFSRWKNTTNAFAFKPIEQQIKTNGVVREPMENTVKRMLLEFNHWKKNM